MKNTVHLEPYGSNQSTVGDVGPGFCCFDIYDSIRFLKKILAIFYINHNSWSPAAFSGKRHEDIGIVVVLLCFKKNRAVLF